MGFVHQESELLGKCWRFGVGRRTRASTSEVALRKFLRLESSLKICLSADLFAHFRHQRII